MAILLVFVLSSLVALAGDIELVASVTNFTLYITFLVINLGVIAMRYKKPGKRPFMVPGRIGRFPLIPLFGAAASLLMLASLGLHILLYGLLLLAAGGAFYIFLRQGAYRMAGKSRG